MKHVSPAVGEALLATLSRRAVLAGAASLPASLVLSSSADAASRPSELDPIFALIEACEAAKKAHSVWPTEDHEGEQLCRAWLAQLTKLSCSVPTTLAGATAFAEYMFDEEADFSGSEELGNAFAALTQFLKAYGEQS